MYDAWEPGGKAAIAKVLGERPADFLKLVAGILPKDMHLKDTTLDDMSHDEIIDTLAAVRRLLAEDAEPAVSDSPSDAGKDKLKGGGGKVH